MGVQNVGARRAFTLIELLVVIAIIAILASILFPVFAQAREKARGAACLSNTKQVGLALMQYTQDFDETLPQVSFPPAGWTGSVNDAHIPKWMDAFYPYVKNGDVFTCPSATDENYATFRPLERRTIRGHNFFGTYGINDAYNGSATDAQTGVAGQPEAYIRSTADTIFAAEMSPNSKASEGGSVKWSLAVSNPFLNPTVKPPMIQVRIAGADQNMIKLRHTRTANILFCDGHAKALQPEKIIETRPVGSARVCHLWTIEED